VLVRTSLAAVSAFVLTACASDEGDTNTGGGTGAGASGGTSGVIDGSSGSFPGGGGVPSAGGAASGGGSASGGAGGSTASGGSGGTAGSGGVVISCNPNGALDCSDPNASAWGCADLPKNYGNALTTAIEQVLSESPSSFDYSNGIPCCPIALQPGAFIDAVVSKVVSQGLCSTPSPLNPSIEVVVKKNNECEESWSVLTSANVVRNPPKHQSTCVATP